MKKKIVGVAVALSLLSSPALANAAHSFEGDFLVAKKGGHGNSGGSSSSSSGSSNSSHSNSDRGNSSQNNSISEITQNDDALKTGQNDAEKKNNDGSSKKTSIEDIKKEKTRLLEEYKDNLSELKARTLELRQQLEATVEGEEKAELLETTADLLDQAGEFEQAITTQEEAVQQDLTNVDRYKKLAKLMDKSGKKDIKAFVNGKSPKFDVPPVIKSGRTLVPIRAISEALGAEVTWNQEEQTAIIVRDGIEIKLTLNDLKAYVDGKEIELDVPSTSINSRIVVPLRFISEAFDAAVQWEDETDSVIIVDNDATDETGTGEPTQESTDASANEEATTTASQDTTDETVQEDTASLEEIDETSTEVVIPTENSTAAIN
ncbi:copper amine oxidase N-terminal domain-containing protein [Schinkia sp. CFF1]